MDAPHTAAAAAHKNTHTHSICGGRNATRISICSPWRWQRLQTTQLWHKQCTNTLRAIFFCCFIVVVVCAHCFAARFFTCFRITDFSSICVYSACIFFFLFCFLSRLRLDNYIGLPPMFGIVPRYTACASAALLYLRRLSASVRERVFCTANKLRAARMNACEHGGEKKKWKKTGIGSISWRLANAKCTFIGCHFCFHLHCASYIYVCCMWYEPPHVVMIYYNACAMCIPGLCISILMQA